MAWTPSDRAKKLAFFAVHEFLDDDFRSAGAEAAFEHEIDRLVAFAFAGGDDDAFARRQPVGLDHHRPAQRIGEGFCRRRLAKAPVGGGGNARFVAKVFDEAFGAFQHGGGPGGAERADAGGLEGVPQSAHQLSVRPYHGKFDARAARKFHQSGEIHGRDRHAFGNRGDSGIAGGAVKLGGEGAGRQRPSQGMFPAARSHQKKFHFGLVQIRPQTLRSLLRS